MPWAASGPVIALAMGERGLISRLLAGKFGGFLTFGRLEGGLGSAPGQPLLSELQGMYRVHAQRSSTKVCRFPKISRQGQVLLFVKRPCTQHCRGVVVLPASSAGGKATLCCADQYGSLLMMSTELGAVSAWPARPSRPGLQIIASLPGAQISSMHPERSCCQARTAMRRRQQLCRLDTTVD